MAQAMRCDHCDPLPTITKFRKTRVSAIAPFTRRCKRLKPICTSTFIWKITSSSRGPSPWKPSDNRGHAVKQVTPYWKQDFSHDTTRYGCDGSRQFGRLAPRLSYRFRLLGSSSSQQYFLLGCAAASATGICSYNTFDPL